MITAAVLSPVALLLFLLCESFVFALVVLDGIEGAPARAACGSFVEPDLFSPDSSADVWATAGSAAPVKAARECALSLSGSVPMFRNIVRMPRAAETHPISVRL